MYIPQNFGQNVTNKKVFLTFEKKLFSNVDLSNLCDRAKKVWLIFDRQNISHTFVGVW